MDVPARTSRAGLASLLAIRPIEATHRVCVTAVLSLSLAACSTFFDSEPNSGSGASTGPGGALVPQERVATITFDGAVHSTYPDITRVGALPGGDVVVATLDFNGRVLLARLDPTLELVWTSGFLSGGGVFDVRVQDGTIFVVVNQSATAVRIARFNVDGSLHDAHDIEGIGASAHLVPLADGGFLLLGKSSVGRFDGEFKVMWSKTIAGDAAIEFDGDFIFAGTPLRLAPANATGIEVVRTSRDGIVRWQTFATPGPGQHSLAGLGLVGDEIVVACGNDSADARSTASLSPLFVSRFDPKTGAHRKTSKAGVSLKLGDGQDATLAFGSGLGAAVKDGILHVGAIVNAGGPSGARTSMVARLDGDTFLGKTIGGAFAVASDATLVGVNLFDSGPFVAKIDRLDGEGACVRRIEGGFAPIEVTTIVDAGGLELPAVMAATPVANVALPPVAATRTNECGNAP